MIGLWREDPAGPPGPRNRGSGHRRDTRTRGNMKAAVVVADKKPRQNFNASLRADSADSAPIGHTFRPRVPAHARTEG